jgi:hypothetical protein
MTCNDNLNWPETILILGIFSIILFPTICANVIKVIKTLRGDIE